MYSAGSNILAKRPKRVGLGRRREKTTLTVLSLKMAVARPTQLALLTSIKGLPAAVRAATVPEHLSFLEIDPANPDLEALKSAEVGRPFCQIFCFFVLPSFFFCNGRFYQCLYLPQLIRRHNEQRVPAYLLSYNDVPFVLRRSCSETQVCDQISS